MTMLHINSSTMTTEPRQAWPWRLKVYTLGRFTLVLDNETLRFRGKVQKKPLELLKALIALGGRQVSHERISDLLWPDSDGDAAKINFKTTLHRLRKLIGAQAIFVQGGKVSLDDHYCWSDVWVFDHLLSALESRVAEHHTSAAELVAALEACAALYQGAFLSRDNDYAWSLTLREKLRARWLHALCSAITLLGRFGECETVVSWYDRAIEVNPLAEECYRGLMGCLAAVGQRAEALALYQQCRTVLATELGIEPSAKTQEIYQAIKQGDNLCVRCEACRVANIGIRHPERYLAME